MDQLIISAQSDGESIVRQDNPNQALSVDSFPFPKEGIGEVIPHALDGQVVIIRSRIRRTPFQRLGTTATESLHSDLRCTIRTYTDRVVGHDLANESAVVPDRVDMLSMDPAHEDMLYFPHFTSGGSMTG